jgi:hypothetical protein
MPLALFSLPKPFRGHEGVIQRNAFRSWAALPGPPELLVFGGEEGAAEAAAAVGARAVPEVARNERRTPFVSDLFDRAERLSEAPSLCYANADVILFDELAGVADDAALWGRPFLVVGQCLNLDVREELELERPEARAALRKRALAEGVLRGPGGIDWFLFSRGLYRDLPAFLVGRAGFDNWLIWRALESRALVGDATETVLAVHQNHGYGHVEGGRAGAYAGDEARRNIELAGGELRLFNIDDASHRLGPQGLSRRPLGRLRRVRALRWLGLRRGQVRRALRRGSR